MSLLPIICVNSVSKTSKQLCEIFQWTSNHGGDSFDELVDAKKNQILWLHDMDAHEHVRFKDVLGGTLGRGVAMYVFVDDIDKTLERVQDQKLSIVEELALNKNAGFREFTFTEANGYFFTVAETL